MPAFCFGQVSDKNIFIYPLNISPALSANFSELRADHFHSGLDLKTGGTTGKEVRAAADGYIYRISVSPNGYGKAVYIRHPQGYSTVYGHLDHFRADIEAYIVARQYEQKNYTITFYPTRDLFEVKQGDIIAWSGNSGGSSGPHLHFEVRESSTENPVNPLFFNLGISDNVKPVIDKIVIYPVTANSSVNNSHNSLSVNAAGISGKYNLSSTPLINVNGLIGFGIKTWDLLDNSANKCGIYSIKVEVDSTEIYEFNCDKFSYSESRYINSHIDYRRHIDNDEYLHKLWLEPGNKLSMYRNVRNRGLISFTDNRTHSVCIRVSDTKGNISILKFKVRSLTKPPIPDAEIKYAQIIPFGKTADFNSEGIKIHFPSSAFYDTVFFTYKYHTSTGNLLSGIHSVHKESIAINDLIRISIRPDTIPPGLENKIYLVRLNKQHQNIYVGGEMRSGYVTAEVRSLGDYAVSIDTTGPEIKPSFLKSADLSGHKSICITIADTLSGIKSYDGYVDGEWVLFEYDSKNNLLTFHPDKKKIKSGILHQLEMKVTDNRGNTSILKSSFTW